MIVSNDIQNRIVKYKLNKKRGVYIVNNYALFKDNVFEVFEKDKKFSDVMYIQDELNKVCDLDNIFAFSKFEDDKREMLEKQKSDFNKKSEKFDDMEKIVVVSEEFVPAEIIDKNKILLSELKQQVKSLKFKIFYYEIQKRQDILDSNISSAVKAGDKIESLKNKLEELVQKYYGILEELNNIQKDNCDKYLCMMSDFCKDKKIPNGLLTLVNKYSEFVVSRFLIDKLVYLISTNLGMISKDKILEALESDEFLKTNYSSIFEEILESLKNVGTDSKFSDK